MPFLFIFQAKKIFSLYKTFSASKGKFSFFPTSPKCKYSNRQHRQWEFDGAYLNLVFATNFSNNSNKKVMGKN